MAENRRGEWLVDYSLVVVFHGVPFESESEDDHSREVRAQAREDAEKYKSGDIAASLIQHLVTTAKNTEIERVDVHGVDIPD
jgi:hypothetical protein